MNAIGASLEYLDGVASAGDVFEQKPGLCGQLGNQSCEIISYHPDGSADAAWCASTTAGESNPAKLIAFYRFSAKAGSSALGTEIFTSITIEVVGGNSLQSRSSSLYRAPSQLH